VEKILTGDCRVLLRDLPAESINCVVTSPPYWGLRDYKIEPLLWEDGWRGVHGLEPTIELYVRHSIEIFREIRRVLRSDGTLWLNLGDSYAGGGRGGNPTADSSTLQGTLSTQEASMIRRSIKPPDGLKPKDLIGVPWRVAFALQADGWYLRQDIIWHKPNPMPESVIDRCTKAHEYLFLFSKSERYYFDAEAIKEPAAWNSKHTKFPDGWDTGTGGHGAFHREGREKGKRVNGAASWKGSAFDDPRDLEAHPDTGRGPRAAGNKSHKGVTEYEASETEEHRTKVGLMNIAETAYETRNKRSVWTIASKPFKGAHFATFPPKLVEPCILAGSPLHGIVLDPFAGAGTVALVARNFGRHCVLMEMNPEYVVMAERRLAGLPVAPPITEQAHAVLP
jgi:DNA modification methylase